MKWNNYLTKLVESRNVLRRNIADYVGISEQYMGDLLNNGKTIPSNEVLQKIISFLSLSEEEEKTLSQLLIQEKLKKNPLLLKHVDSGNIDVTPQAIPIVSVVGANDDLGRTCFHPLNPPYKTINTSGCKAMYVDNNSMSPLVWNGQKIFYREDLPVKDNDLVFVKLKSGDQLFKRYFKKGKQIILNSQDTNYSPIIVDESEVEYCYKVVGTWYI